MTNSNSKRLEIMKGEKSDTRTWSQGFDEGFIAACTHLVKGHGEDGYAKFLLIGAGYTQSKIKNIKLDSFDKTVLRKVFKELEP